MLEKLNRFLNLQELKYKIFSNKTTKTKCTKIFCQKQKHWNLSTSIKLALKKTYKNVYGT